MFGAVFQPSESLKALAFFDDGDPEALSKDDRQTLVEAASAVRDLPAVAIVSRKLGYR